MPRKTRKTSRTVTMDIFDLLLQPETRVNQRALRELIQKNKGVLQQTKEASISGEQQQVGPFIWASGTRKYHFAAILITAGVDFLQHADSFRHCVNADRALPSHPISSAILSRCQDSSAKQLDINAYIQGATLIWHAASCENLYLFNKLLERSEVDIIIAGPGNLKLYTICRILLEKECGDFLTSLLQARERRDTTELRLSKEEYLQAIHGLMQHGLMAPSVKVLNELTDVHGSDISWVYSMGEKKKHLLHTALEYQNLPLFCELLKIDNINIYEQCPHFGSTLFALFGGVWRAKEPRYDPKKVDQNRMELIFLKSILKMHQEFSVAAVDDRPHNYDPEFLYKQSDNKHTLVHASFQLTPLQYVILLSSDEVILTLLASLKDKLATLGGDSPEASLIHASINTAFYFAIKAKKYTLYEHLITEENRQGRFSDHSWMVVPIHEKHTMQYDLTEREIITALTTLQRLGVPMRGERELPACQLKSKRNYAEEFGEDDAALKSRLDSYHSREVDGGAENPIPSAASSVSSRIKETTEDAKRWAPLKDHVSELIRQFDLPILEIMKTADISPGDSLLHHTVNLNLIEVLRWLLTQALDVNEWDIPQFKYRYLIRGELVVRDLAHPEALTPLMLALILGRWQMVSMLLESGASVDITYKNLPFMNALHLAILLKAPVGILRELKAKSGVPTIIPYHHLAAVHGSLEVMELFISQENINDVAGVAKITPLHLATAFASNASVQWLLERKADPNLALSEALHGETALHLAIRERSSDKVRLLLAVEGINVNALAFDEHTPVHYAILFGLGGVISQLAATGSLDLTLKTQEKGYSPLSLAQSLHRENVTSQLLTLLSSRSRQTQSYAQMQSQLVSGQNSAISSRRFLQESGYSKAQIAEFLKTEKPLIEPAESTTEVVVSPPCVWQWRGRTLTERQVQLVEGSDTPYYFYIDQDACDGQAENFSFSRYSFGDRGSCIKTIVGCSAVVAIERPSPSASAGAVIREKFEITDELHKAGTPERLLCTRINSADNIPLIIALKYMKNGLHNSADRRSVQPQSVVPRV